MLLHNLEIAWRNLMKYRLQSCISILSLAVGIKNLKGEHVYRLSESEYIKLRELFQFNGIHRYEILVKSLPANISFDMDGYSQLFLHLEPGLTGPMMGVSYDVIAHPQIQVTVKAPDLNAMRRFLSSHGMQIRDLIEDHQLQMRVANLQRKHSQKISADLRQTLGMDIHAPEQIRATKKGKDFLWAGTNLNEKDQNLVVYTYPWDGSDVLTADYMAMKRDSMMRVNIPGSQPDQWMQTTREQGIPMLTSEVRPIGGRLVQEVHGLWEMRCGALGGPFVSLSRIDTARHRVIVAEGFVYSPGTPKRDLLRELEAALRTLTISAKN